MMKFPNQTFHCDDDRIRELLEQVYNNEKIYGAFIFGSRFHGDFTSSSDWDIALFTDLDFFSVAMLQEDFNNKSDVEVDIVDICNLPDDTQREIIENDFRNILFLKDNYVVNWDRHIDYLLSQCNFRDLVREVRYGI